MRVLYLDTETTGLDPKRNGVVQIAGQLVERGKVLDEFNLHVAPFSRDEIDQRALNVNGLTVEEIAGFKDPVAACNEFVAFLRAYTPGASRLFIAGYNIGFDILMLREWFNKCGMTGGAFMDYFWTPPIDVMTLAGFRLMDEREKLRDFKQSTVAQYLGVKIDGEAHDAAVDIKTTRGILRAIYPVYAGKRS